MTELEFIKRLEEDNIKMEDIPKLLVEKLDKKGLKISSAESCTGGMISEMITSVSGASNVFDLGVCSYANAIKNKVLSVDNEVLNTVGAVSKETATAMADGVRKLGNADIGVSTTGIAGPTGGTKEKPVGLVYVGLSFENKINFEQLLLNDNREHSRDEIRRLSSYIALYLVLKEIG